MLRAPVSWLVVLAACGTAAQAPQGRAPAAVAAPTTVDAKRTLFVQARAAAAAQRDQQAIAMLEPLCPVYVEMQDYCWHELAGSRARAGDTTGADALWARLVSTYPQSLYVGRANLERGRLRRARGDSATAQSLFEAARASDEDDVAAQALLELADMAEAAGNADTAQADLLAVRTRWPGSASGREAKRRLDDLRRQVPRLEPQGAALDTELQLLLAERDFAAARGAADRLLATAPAADRPELLRRRADAELGAGQLEPGLATLQLVVREAPGSTAAADAQFRYATLLWNRDRNEEARQAFVEFRQRYPEHPRQPDALYALARIAQNDGDADAAITAYAQLADVYPASPLAAEARWRIGWIRYQQRRFGEAAQAFERAAADSDAAAGSAAQYWRARALEHTGDRDGAERVYRALLVEAPGSYYAYWSEQRLGRPPAPATTVAAPPPAPPIGSAPPSTDPFHWVRAGELQAMGMHEMARAELRAFEHAYPDQPETTRPTVAAYQSVNGYRDAIRLASARGLTDPSIFFPLAFWPEVTRQTRGDDVDPLLVLALMRQESMFDPAARSSADARGLMQLLPSTAERVARRAGQPPPTGKLSQPQTNISLGVAHLRELLQTYHGDSLKALAAYNGGEDAVAKWERRFADLAPDEFVESITYRETRDYVKRVIGNYRRYQQEYGH